MDEVEYAAPGVDRLIARCVAEDGHPPFSGRKRETLDGDAPGIVGVWGRRASIEIAAVAVRHEQASGAVHWSVEVAVDPSVRPDAEVEALECGLRLVPADVADSATLWAFRRAQVEAAAAVGLEPFRDVLLMAVPLPVEAPEPRADYAMRPMRVGEDEASIAALNNEAFAGHRENDAMTPADVRRKLRSPEARPDGVLIVEPVSDGRPAGFCWTTMPDRHTGEIHIIGLSPDHHGRGVGSWLVRAALADLHRRGAATCRLWSDADNEDAVRLYRRVGFEVQLVNRELRRAQPNG